MNTLYLAYWKTLFPAASELNKCEIFPLETLRTGQANVNNKVKKIKELEPQWDYLE